MIFVTVGTDMPFDRLVRAVDRWAAECGRTDVFAQIGEGGWEPEHMPFSAFLGPAEFTERLKSASVVIGHAGMGTILSALRFQKPLLIMPRRASLGEQRNEHQLATAKHLAAMGKVQVADDEADLLEKLAGLDGLCAKEPIGDFASPQLIRALGDFIKGPARDGRREG